MDIVMHSYTFRRYPLVFAFKNAARFGWDGIELQPCHFDRERIAEELPDAIALGHSYGVPIRCVDFGGDFINENAGEIEAAVRQAEHEIAVCGEHGITLMNGTVGSLVAEKGNFGKNGSAIAQPAHYERAAEALRHLGDCAGKHGIRLVLEIHMNCLHDTIASTAKLLDMVKRDNVMANPDPGNMFSTSTAEKDPDDLDRLDGRVGYFHFKNCAETQGVYSYSVNLADGHIDMYKWVEKLIGMGYGDAVCIEYCGAGDPHVPAQADIDYLRRCIAFCRGA